MKYILITLIYSTIACAYTTPTDLERRDTFIPTCCSAEGCEPEQRVELSGSYQDPGSAARACLTHNNAKVHHIVATSEMYDPNQTSNTSNDDTRTPSQSGGR